MRREEGKKSWGKLTFGEQTEWERWHQEVGKPGQEGKERRKNDSHSHKCKVSPEKPLAAQLPAAQLTVYGEGEAGCSEGRVGMSPQE